MPRQPKRPVVPVPAPPRRGRKAPFDGAPVERLTLFLPSEVAAAIRVTSAKQKKTFSEVIAEMVKKTEGWHGS